MSDPKSYTVGWICAIKTEFVAAQVLLDERHDPPEYIAQRDNNSYALGRIHKHNVAIAVLPDGEYGLSQAAAVARDMLHTFPNIRIGLMVGIGGGAPTSRNDIRLGDVVVSAPRDGHSGIFEYDFGKTIQEQNFQYTKHLDQPPAAVRAAVTSLQADYECNGHNIRETINKIIAKNKRLRKYGRPDINTDVLYRPEVIHPMGAGDCVAACGVDSEKLVQRKKRDENDGDDDPAIHYGLIASANQLMKDATVRNRLAAERGVLCFEMEAAGLMNHFPCLVIRGICDYSDTHKNDTWHGYAAMTAAAYAVDILRRIHPNKVEAERTIAEVVESVQETVLEIRNSMASVRQDDEITAWLGASNPANKHNAVRQSRHEGTGIWLLTDHRYKNWKNTVGSFLWLSGIAGCGKTVLSSTVVDDLQSCHSSANLIHFYFQFDDEAKPTLESLLRSLISQCYWTSEESKRCVRGLWEEITKKHKSEQPTSEQLYSCLVQILTKSDRFWVVVDALDECNTTEGPFKKGILAFIESLRQDTKKYTHILVTSRAEQVIENKFSRWVRDEEIIPLQQSMIHQDIESYVEHQLRRSGGFDRWQGRADILENIKSTLMSQADGMFRWVACQLVSLANCLDPQGLKEALSSLPRGLDATYQRMIQEIPDRRKSNAITILRFLAFSDRPLTVDELVDALAVNTTATPPTFDPANRMPRPNEISQYCPGLVIVQRVQKKRKNSGKKPPFKEFTEVRLAHFSVKEFLTSDRLQEELRHQMEYGVSMVYLTKICVSYISQLDKEMSKAEMEAEFPFARYSAESWMGYAASRPAVKNTEIDTLILDFLLSNEVAYRNWFRLSDPERFFEDYGYGSHLGNTPAPCLYYACLHGMTADVEALISHSVDVNTRGGKHNYALHAAAGRGHVRILRLLISNGANVNSEGPYKQTALHFAAIGGHEEACQILLGAGADINAVSAWYSTTGLGIACASGNVSVVKLLIDWGANVNPPVDRSPLGFACCFGHGKIVDLLISKGVKVEAAQFEPDTPLNIAASKGYTGIVSKLLQHGANPNLLSSEDFSPLESASRFGHEDIVKVLLDNGASVNRTPLAINGSALYLAAHGGYTGLVRTLLDAGADPNSRGGYIAGLALERAAFNGNTEIVRNLLDKGAQVNHRGRSCWGSEALLYACQRGHETIVQDLLEMNADVNSTGTRGTALQVAISAGHTKIVEKLIEYGANLEIVHKGPNGGQPSQTTYTPLLWAYGRGDQKMMKLLLDKGADLYAPAENDNNGNSVLEIACLDNNVSAIKTLLDWGFDIAVGLPAASLEGHLELVQLLLDNGCDPDVQNDKFGNPLGAASYRGHIGVVRLLLERKANVDALSSIYGSALLAASSKRHNDVVQTLLSHGADPNGSYGNTRESKESDNQPARYWKRDWLNISRYGNALQAASQGGYEDTVRLLIEGGANVNLTGGEYGSAIFAALYQRHNGMVKILLKAGAKPDATSCSWGHAVEEACRKGHDNIVGIMIENNYGLFSECFYAALLREIQRGNTEIARALLEDWRSPTLPDSTALTEAIESERYEILQLIIEKTGDFTGRNGIGPLHAAAAWGNKRLVLQLLDRGADITSPGPRFCNALVAASANGNQKVVEILLDRGAEPNVQHDIAAQSVDLRGKQVEAYGNALHAASQQGHVKVVQLLLNRGADPTISAGRHKNLLAAVVNGYSHMLKLRRHSRLRAKKYGLYFNKLKPKKRFETVLQLLLDNGADAEFSLEDYGELLVWSSFKGFAGTVTILIERCINVVARNATHTMSAVTSTALYAALSRGHLEVVRILVDIGYKVADWEHGDRGYNLALLHYAAWEGRTDIVQRCISAHMDINKSSSNGLTPLRLATMQGHHDIVQILLSNGAEPIRVSQG